MRAIIIYNHNINDIALNPLESFIVWSKGRPKPAIIKANEV